MSLKILKYIFAMAASSLSLDGHAGFDQYAITDIGSLVTDTASSNNFSYAFDINDRGDVAGVSKGGDGKDHAIFWSGGQLTDLGLGRAVGINDHREIVGWGSSTNYQLWRYAANAFVMETLGIAKGGQVGFKGQAIKINERGEIAAYSKELDPLGSWYDDIMVFWKDGQISRVGLVNCLAQHIPALNNSGEVVESEYEGTFTSIFYGRSNSYLQVAPPSDGGSYEPVAMNDLSEAVGMNGAYYSPKSGFRTLAAGQFWDINNAGLAVGGGSYGEYSGASINFNLASEAFIFSVAEDSYAQLQSLIPGFASSGFQKLRIASAINNAGQIVGVGLTVSGKLHAFLLTPLR